MTGEEKLRARLDALLEGSDAPTDYLVRLGRAVAKLRGESTPANLKALLDLVESGAREAEQRREVVRLTQAIQTVRKLRVVRSADGEASQSVAVQRESGDGDDDEDSLPMAAPWMDIFLQGVRRRGTTRAGAELAQISRRTAERWRHKDERFALAWEDAERDYEDMLREEIYRRGVEGVADENGVKRYSDRLLVVQALARMPEYREGQRRTQVSEDGSGSLTAVEMLEAWEAEKRRSAEEQQEVKGGS